MTDTSLVSLTLFIPGQRLHVSLEDLLNGSALLTVEIDLVAETKNKQTKLFTSL